MLGRLNRTADFIIYSLRYKRGRLIEFAQYFYLFDFFIFLNNI